MGYDKTAIKHLEEARALRPATAEILLRLAVLYKRTGNDQLAAEANTALIAVKSQAVKE
jgi:Flp pilus assembly protein TadD